MSCVGGGTGAKERFPKELKKCCKALGIELHIPKNKSKRDKDKKEEDIDTENTNLVKEKSDSIIDVIIENLKKRRMKAKLEEEIEDLKGYKDDWERVDNLRQDSEDEIKNLNQKLKADDEKIRKAEEEIQRLTDENRQTKEKYEARIDEEARNHAEMIDSIKKQNEEDLLKHQDTINLLRSDALSDMKTKDDSISRLKDDLKDSQTEIASLQREKQSTTNENTALKVHSAEQEKLIERQHQDFEQYKAQSNQVIYNLRLQHQQREEQIQQGIDNLRLQLQTQAAQSRQTIDHLQSNVVAERKAKEDALTRLSAAAASKLRDKNPGITDLSDPNRPLKLSEKMSELYDNEWTNAMEKLEDLEIDENKGIEIMLDIVTNLFDRFRQLGQRQLENISKVVVVPDFDGELNEEKDLDKIPELPIEILKPLKDFRKAHADIAIQRLQQTFARDCLADRVDSKCLESCTEYIASCTELMWLMQVQDPPVHIEWDINPDDDFDTNTMRSYTKSGKYVDYVVWPILYLHKGGPLLCKGVVQGKKTKKTKEEAQAEGQNKMFDDGESASKNTNNETEVDGTNIQNGNDIQDQNDHTSPSNSSRMNFAEPPQNNGKESTAAQTNEANHTSEDSQGENDSKSDPSISSNGDEKEEDSFHPIPHSTEAAEPSNKEREESPEEESESSHSLNEEKDGDTTSDTQPTHEAAAGPTADETCEEGRERSKSSGQSSQGSDNREYFDAEDKPYEPEEKYSDCHSDVPYTTDRKKTNYEEELD